MMDDGRAVFNRNASDLGVEIPGPNTTLWRYMSLSKLMEMLQTRTIWFSRVDQLIASDPYEGSLPFLAPTADQSNSARREAEFEERHNFVAGSLATMREMHRESFIRERKKTYVSCWHSGLTDNDAMWRLYGAEKDGSVCVKTTASRLLPQLPNWINAGRVKYVSYHERWPENSNVYLPYFRKRTCFEHEREVRLLFNNSVDPVPVDFKAEAIGYRVQFDPGSAFQTIYISPTAPSWFEGVVAENVKHLHMHIPVEPAPMALKPAF